MLTLADIKIRVEQCLDSEEWVWSLLDDYNGVRCDGYSATEADAMRDAKRARREEIDRLNAES